jgi:L-threonylcarbamoyladenylate synthase
MRVSLEDAVRLLLAGELVAIPTDTVYGIAASIHSQSALDRIYQLKGRPSDKPLPILGSLEQLSPFAEDGPWQALAHQYWPGPLTLVVPGQPNLPPQIRAADGTVALRWPAGDQVNALLQSTGPLAVTSANRSGEPPARSPEEIEEQLGSCPILASPKPLTGMPSTIIGYRGGRWELIRPGTLDLSAIATD